MLHTLRAQQAAAELKAALIGFAIAIDTGEDPLPSAIVVTFSVQDEDAEASFELFDRTHAYAGGSL